VIVVTALLLGLMIGSVVTYRITVGRLQPAADVWDDGYWLGVNDMELSYEWTNRQVPPARQNPYV
jgi:hypothetical protein